MTNTKQRTVYVNGQYLPEDQATVSIFDRGYLMADAVYEYTAVLGFKLLEFDAHMDRLERSLNELSFDYVPDRAALLQLHRELIERNAIDVGGVYLQISRGVADRNFLFPTNIDPTITAFTQEVNFLEHPANQTGLKVISIEDCRWSRRDIKTVQLLYTSMAKTEAIKRGAHDAFFVEDGFVTEATAANAFIVKHSTIITHQMTNAILHGVTRKSILDLASELDLAIEHRPFTIAEAQAADEVFITASPLYVLGVTDVDGVSIASGKPGEITNQLRAKFLENARKMAV